VTNTQELPILPDAVRALGISKTYARESILQFQDEEFSHIAYIQTGRAFAVHFDIDGNESWINEFLPGQFIGCDALFGTPRSNCQIVAKTPVSTLLFSKDNFLKLMEDHQEVNKFVIKDLAAQIRKFTVQALEAQSLSMRGRIASELSRLAKPIGKEPDTHIIRPTPIFSELAQRLGSTRETVSRTVSSLVKKDVMERRTGALVIHNLANLEAQIR